MKYFILVVALINILGSIYSAFYEKDYAKGTFHLIVGIYIIYVTEKTYGGKS